MDGKLVVALILTAILLIALALNAWKMMRGTDQMLDRIDKQKLKDLENDGWDD